MILLVSYSFYLLVTYSGAEDKLGFRRFQDFLQEWPTPVTGPYFDTSMNSNITGIFGRTISLICRVKNLGNRTVSWVRHRDTHLLTVGRYTYTSDQRFEAVHIPHTEDWTLRIKYPQKKDTGIYECQISTTPPMGHFVLLTIVEPTAEIIGHQEVHIDAGSTINLTCAVLHATETRRDVWWSRDGRPIDAGSPRGGVSVVTEKGAKTTSRLLIRRAGLADSGMYKCEQPEARVAARVVVHVLEGEYPAAMYHGNGSLARKSLMILLPSLVFLLIHQSAT